ncbi:hypothetical protein QOZ80_6AG0517950 [Eleusine coracana subsp. coracana]|nr:hypothetical protein QOZ80_6AG0517950 [Eleusine coracana subsp. coracana]
MAAAGRRVKLDLFVDPSPGEASLKEGIGGGNHDQQTVVPTSPSSSGGFHQFPSKGYHLSTEISGCDCCAFGKKENPLTLLGQYSDDEEEDDEAAGQPTDEIKGSPRDASAKVTHEYGDTAGDKGNAHTELSAAVGEQPDVPQAGENCISIAEDNTVAHEPTLEINSTEATDGIPDTSGMQIVGDVGETSWEMPNGLAPGVASVPTTHMDYSIEAHTHVLPQTTLEVYPTEVSVGNGTSAYATFGMECGTAQYTQDAYAYATSATSHEDIDPLQLAKYGEGLLQRLNELERILGSIEGLELIRREVGIRISDCNALSAYGSSLLPLWLHAEVHLKQLDSSISKLETSNNSYVEPTQVAEAPEHNTPNQIDIAAPSNGEDLKFEASSGVTVGVNVKIEEHVPTSSAQSSHDEDPEAIASKVEIDNDEDMDVDMEVDEDDVEEQVNSDSVDKEHPTPEQVSSPNLPSSGGLAEDNDVPPPPPEEEWIPPPPPDSEPAPPPPPEEPVASHVHPDTVPQPYIGQANVGYTLSGMEYYAAVGTDGTSATYYVQASEPHVLQAQQQSYYAPVSASGISVPVDSTSVAQESYYTYPSVPATAGGVAAEHSGYYTSSVSAISSSAVDIKSSTSLVAANSNLDPTSIGSDFISKDAGVPILSQAVVATSAAGTTSMLGTSTQASASTTNQTKVVRSKKRPVAVTSSLRSNKKVSSLVDKWKAAKDELRDEEEEPENALEALERKRQKEIEEWRKQQIASREAKENANFVPVRGDWRDRVKRRRVEAKKEAKDESITASLSPAEHHTGQPDVAELSKGLPSGWQAYLDESTKQVYYGNNHTSETTWARPTK